jgi:Ni/Fe-hydrogenase subunit HybB-like protein
MMTHTTSPKPVEARIITLPALVLTVLFLISAYFLVLRYIGGIGPVSNLTHNQSWGLWKVIGVLVGAALVNGGYVTAFVVYIMNRGQYHRFVRQAVLFSLLGYGFAGLSLAYDTGRYVNLLNFFIPKYMQTNSVLFEVGVCITAYIVILFIEFLPAVLEKFMPEGKDSKNWAASIHSFLNKILFLTVGMGVVLPTMHQSGLGGLAVLFGNKLSPLWYSPALSLLYVVSSIFMGFCVVVAVECWTASSYNRKVDAKLMGTLLKMAKYVAVLYVLIRWVEIIRMGGVGAAFDFGLEAGSFWLEWILLILGFYFARNSALTSLKSVFYGTSLLLASGLLYRINTYIVGFEGSPGVTYFPSFPELMISVGMFALQILVFITAIKLFPILEEE